jgi:hypothetical protein
MNYITPDNTIINETAAIIIRDMVLANRSASEIFYYLVSNSINSFSNRPFTINSVNQAIMSLKNENHRPTSLAALSFKAISRNVETQKDCKPQ